MTEIEILALDVKREKLKLAKSEHSLSQAEHARGQWRNPLWLRFLPQR